MDFLKDIQEETLLILNIERHEQVLTYLDKINALKDIKLMSKEEFLKHFFYDYSEETIYYIVKKYHVNKEIAILYLENMKYAINLKIDNFKINFLKELYKDLKENNLLIFDSFFNIYLKNTNILVLESDDIDLFTKKIFNTLKAKYIQEPSKENKIRFVYHFKNIEEECSYVFNKISEYIKSGVNPWNIKIIPLGDEYIPFLKRFSFLYNIPLNNIEKVSIYGTPLVKKFLNWLRESFDNKEIISNLEKYTNNDITTNLINLLNKYSFISDRNDLISFIENDLQNTYKKEVIYKNGIDIIKLNSFLTRDNDIVFVLGFNLENIPKNYKDIDYFNDSLKEEIGLFTSITMNKLEYKNVIYHLNNINNLYISYKDSDPYQVYYKANIIDDLNLEIREGESINNTSNLYNKIKLTKELDLMLKYGTIFPDTSLLYNTYSNLPYLKYDNSFTGIKRERDKIYLSYTAIDSYYRCSFRYYINQVLKLDIYDDSFNIFIGNLFHYVLSHIADKNFDFNSCWDSYLNQRVCSIKEQVYLNFLKKDFQKILNGILYQHSLSSLTSLALEKEILITKDKYIFKGIIDKIMYSYANDKTYISLIDYKTGLPKTDMSNLKYGIDMQLPVYIYLIKNSNLFSNPCIIGFYFQQIIHEKDSYNSKKNEEERIKDNLKLLGYTRDSEDLVSLFDKTYHDSEMIKGMKTTNNGFAYYTKLVSEDMLNNLCNLVEKKINEAFKKIEDSNFDINPKIIGGENLGCKFCQYKDLCFKTGKDYIYLEKEKDLSYLEKN